MNLYEILQNSDRVGEGMTHFERLFAQKVGGGKINEISGIPPLRYIGDGRPLTDYRIAGNAIQNGTPSPDAPADAAGSGVRTGNLVPFPYYQSDGTLGGVTWTTYSNGRVVGTGKTSAGINFAMASDLALPNGTYTIAVYGAHSGMTLFLRDVTSSEFLVNIPPSSSDASQTFTVNQPGVHRLYFNTGQTGRDVDIDCYIMLNLGPTALPYEPYGYKLPMTVNGTEYPIYLGQVETTRRINKLVFTGEETFIQSDTANHYRVRTTVLPKTIGYAINGMICTHYKPSNSSMDNSVSTSSDGGVIYFYDDTNATTTTSFKQYLHAQYAAGTPVTVWYVLAEPETGIVNEPLMKIGDYADTISFAQAGVTIPTVNGENVLDVPTTVPPSEVLIRGRIKEV